MIEGSSLAKSITDASWKQFQQFLTYKAEEAGRKLGLVNPAYTTRHAINARTLKLKSSLKESIDVQNVGIGQQGTSMQRKIFWPSD